MRNITILALIVAAAALFYITRERSTEAQDVDHGPAGITATE